MKLMRWFLTCTFLFVLSSIHAQERAPGVRRLVFVLEVDVERALAAGWTGRNREEVVELATRLLERRFVAMDRAAVVEASQEAGRLEVKLPSIDSRDRELCDAMLRSLGSLEFLFLASEELLKGRDVELDEELRKLAAWRQLHPDASVATFNALRPEEQGPHRSIEWAETQYTGDHGEVVRGSPSALVLPTTPEEHFGAGSLARVYGCSDHLGFPAIGFEFSDARAEEFRKLTAANRHQRLGIVIEGKVRSAPTLEAELHGAGLIEGRFAEDEVARLQEAFERHVGVLRIVEIR